MEQFHKTLYWLNGKHKKELSEILSDRFPFKYRELSFGFTGINHCAPEELTITLKSPLHSADLMRNTAI